ncbi:F-box protein, partial [Candidatus Bathyarchaeota archaeon]|nr:F-box protein [Candidatus Bathyarchaeota archaeon]
ADIQTDAEDLAALLFHLVRRRPIPEGLRLDGRANPRMYLTREVIASLAEASDALQSTEAPRISGGHGQVPDRGDTFGGLPFEIVVPILSQLPSTDVCSLRLASKAVAGIFPPHDLPQPFWKSRFAPGFEMAFPSRGEATLGQADHVLAFLVYPCKELLGPVAGPEEQEADLRLSRLLLPHD